MITPRAADMLGSVLHREIRGGNMKDIKYVEDDNYFSISGWMVTRLGLESLAETAVYSIIYGFSCSSDKFTGSLQYLAEWTNVSRSTVIRILNHLVERKLILKTVIEKQGQRFCEYVANFDYEVDGEKVVKKPKKLQEKTLGDSVPYTPCHDDTPRVTMTLPPCHDDTQYNNIYNNTSYSNTSYIHTSYEYTRNNYTRKSEYSDVTTSELKKLITKNSKIHKWVNRVVSYLESKKINKEVYKLLIDFIKNLVEMEVRIPFSSIQQQVDALLELSVDKQKQAVNETIINGWKSLKFSIDKQNGAAAETPRYRNGRDSKNYKNNKNSRRYAEGGGDKSKSMTEKEKAELRKRMLESDKNKWY